MKTCNNSYAIGDEHIYRIHATRESITNFFNTLDNTQKIVKMELDKHIIEILTRSIEFEQVY